MHDADLEIADAGQLLAQGGLGGFRLLAAFADRLARAVVDHHHGDVWQFGAVLVAGDRIGQCRQRSEEHTSELQSLMRISYAVFCLKKKTNHRYGAINGTHKEATSKRQ